MSQHHHSAKGAVLVIVDSKLSPQSCADAGGSAGAEVFNRPVQAVPIGDRQKVAPLGLYLVGEGFGHGDSVMGGVGAADMQVWEAHPQSTANTHDPSASRRRS